MLATDTWRRVKFYVENFNKLANCPTFCWMVQIFIQHTFFFVSSFFEISVFNLKIQQNLGVTEPSGNKGVRKSEISVTLKSSAYLMI